MKRILALLTALLLLCGISAGAETATLSRMDEKKNTVLYTFTAAENPGKDSGEPYTVEIEYTGQRK